MSSVGDSLLVLEVGFDVQGEGTLRRSASTVLRSGMGGELKRSSSQAMAIAHLFLR